MSGKEEQIDMDLGIDDAPPAAKVEETEVVEEVVVESATEGDAATQQEPTLDGDQGIQELKRRYESEKLARIEAEKRARDAARQAEKANSQVHDVQINLVQTAFDNLKRDQEILKNSLKESMAIGDFDRAAEIQEAMSMNSAKILQLEHGLSDMKARPPQPQTPPAQQGEMTVDDLIQRVNSPISKNWLMNNRNFISDSRSIRIMARAHEDAIDMGVIPESPEYFSMIENRLGINRQPPPQQPPAYQDQALSGASAPTQRRSSPAAAPVSRSPVSNNGTRQQTIRLTPEEVEAAKISGLTTREYWELKQKERNRN